MLEDNLFYQMGLSPMDTKSTIMESIEEAELFQDEESVREAKDVLLHPYNRVASEIGSFIGLSHEEIQEVAGKIGYLKLIAFKIDFFEEIDSINKYISEESLHGTTWDYDIEKTNVLIEVLESFFKMKVSKGTEIVPIISEVIKRIATYLENIDPDELLESLNELREEKNEFPPINDIVVLSRYIDDYKKSAQRKIEELLSQCSSVVLEKVIIQIARETTNFGQNIGLELTDKVIDAVYRVGIYQYLQEENGNIKTVLSKIDELIKKAEADTVKHYIDEVTKMITKWITRYTPILWLEMSRDRQDAIDKVENVLFALRNVLIKFYNEKPNDYYLETQLNHLKALNVANSTKMNEYIAKDLAFLEGRKKKTSTQTTSSQGRVIQKKTTQSTGDQEKVYFHNNLNSSKKSLLHISDRKIIFRKWESDIKDITGLGWGSTTTIKYYFFRHTDYYVNIKMNNDLKEFWIWPKKQQDFNSIIDALWSVAGYRLADELINTLKNGQIVGFKSVSIKNDGVILTKSNIFSKDEHVFFTWDEVDINSADGSFFIYSNIDRKFYVELSYQAYNVPMLSLVLNAFYKQRKQGQKLISDVF